MWQVSKLCIPVLAGSVLLTSAITSPSTAFARDMRYTDRADGGVEITFPNGCSVIYDSNAKRSGQSGRCKNKQLKKADGAASSHLKAADRKPGGATGSKPGQTEGGKSGKQDTEGQGPVAESMMQSYCRAEAAARLGTQQNDVLTMPVERKGSGYAVYGQTPTSGLSATTFECRFDSNRVFQTIMVPRQAQQ